MMTRTVIIILCSSLLFLSCNNDRKSFLFDGETLDNWKIIVENPDVEPGNLFWVADGSIQTSGQPNGYIRTINSYSNYKLHVEWRWTETPTNSGVLLHVQGKDVIWPLCIECQLKHEHAGDIVLIGVGAGVTSQETTYLVDSEETWYKIIPKFDEVSEHEPGQWNSYDITSMNGEIRVVVNGVLQHTGSMMTLTEGAIALQAEGSPMQFRNIYLETL
ncbi:MAG: DUF1080 domain-containing protein [Bacteroidota bacterium]